MSANRSTLANSSSRRFLGAIDAMPMGTLSTSLRMQATQAPTACGLHGPTSRNPAWHPAPRTVPTRVVPMHLLKSCSLLGAPIASARVVNSTAQPEQISFRDVQRHDFLEEVIQRLIGMCHQNYLLIWKVVKEQIHHLQHAEVPTHSTFLSWHACTAVSVFPVPGGPTTMVSPGFTPERMASTCTGVKRMKFSRGLE